MRPPTVVALAVAVAFLAASTPATAAATAPGDLWSEFPVEPRAATTPVPASPAPAVERPEAVRDDESGGQARPTRLLILLGALVAAVAALAGQRFATRQAPADDEPKRPAVPVTVELPVSGGGAGDTGRVAVAGRAASFAATRTTPTLIETLSPQARLADQLEKTGVDSASEAQEVCEIACWRGYVSWQFYAELTSSVATSVCSPYFRAPGKGGPKPTAAALRAHEMVVEKLISAGWEPQGSGEDWFATRFRRAPRLPSA